MQKSGSQRVRSHGLQNWQGGDEMSETMGVTVTRKKIVLEFPREEFGVLEPSVIEREVLNDLRRLKAVKEFSLGKISGRELIRLLGPEKALSIIEAKKITKESIKKVINDYKASL